MENNIFEFTGESNRECPCCGKLCPEGTMSDEKFLYGAGNDTVELSARVLIWKCSECEFEFTDGQAEAIRHEAVCHHLDLLCPREIRAIRRN